MRSATLQSFRLFAAVAPLGLGGMVQGQCLLEWVTPPTGGAALNFGVSYALHENTVVVGAYAEHVGAAQNAGAAYVFRRGAHGLSAAQRLEPPVPADNLFFGQALATDGQRVVASTAASATGSSGAIVFVDVGGTFVLEQVLPPPVVTPQAYGAAMAITGDRLAARSNTGQIDLYERIAGTWTLVTTLQKANGAAYSWTCELLFHGPRLYVFRDRWVNNDNHVEIWRRTQQGWVFEHRLVGGWSVSQTTGFGAALAVSGDRIAVGDPDWGGRGRVLVFDRIGAVIGQTGSFEASSASYLGTRVSFDGARIVVSEPLFNGPHGRSAISIYEDQTFGWTEIARHERPATLATSVDWRALELRRTSFLTEADLPQGGGGAPLDVMALIDVVPQPDVRFCPTSANSTGFAGRVDVEGTRSVAALDTTLVARQLPLSSFVLFVYGAREGQSPLGNGVLCVDPLAGGLVRIAPTALADSAGVATIPFLPASAPASAPLEPGRSYVFQAWYRDVAGGGALFNLTDALRVSFCP